MERVLLALAALVAAGCGVVHQDAGERASSDARGWIVVPAATLTGEPSRDLYDYFAVRPDGSGLRKLALPLGELDLDFSADGRVAALSVSSPDPSPDPGVDIVISPTDRWEPRKLPLPRRSGYSPALSPDGQTVALSYAIDQAANLWTVSTDGQGLERVASTGGVTSSAWSRDGAWIAFTDELAAREIDAAVVYLVRPDGTELHRLPGEFANERPAWSADGKRLALEDWEGRVAIVAVDGSGTQILTADGHEPAWSPDGKWIAFKRLVPDKGGVYHMEVLVTPAAGGTPHRIASFDGGSSSGEPLSWTTADPPG